MDDPRLLEWLALAERALQAPEAERLERLGEVRARRAELQSSLRVRPPQSSPGPELALRLRDSEAQLGALMAQLRTEIRSRLAELRQVRGAARSYRPVRSDRPAFVSRSI